MPKKHIEEKIKKLQEIVEIDNTEVGEQIQILINFCETYSFGKKLSDAVVDAVVDEINDWYKWATEHMEIIETKETVVLIKKEIVQL